MQWKWTVWSHAGAVEWKLGRWFSSKNLWLKESRMLLGERQQREAHLLPLGLSSLEGEQHFQTEKHSGKLFCCLLQCCFSSCCSLVLHWRAKATDTLQESPTESNHGQDFGTNLTCETVDLRDDLAGFYIFLCRWFPLLFKIAWLKLRFNFQLTEGL